MATPNTYILHDIEAPINYFVVVLNYHMQY